jgi:RNA polymerase sigma-70 factor (ECF subfamily)
MQRDLMVRVEQAIAAMDPTDQEILAMRHFEELTNKETAEALDITQKAASIRYFRALKRLQEILRQYSIFLSGTRHER